MTLTEPSRDEFSAFITTHWTGDEAAWFGALDKTGWLDFSKPGSGWPRVTQLTFLEELAVHDCPLFPDRNQVIHRLHELQTALCHIRRMHTYWNDEVSPALAELELEYTGLRALFLKSTRAADQQIEIRTRDLCYEAYRQLFQLLGYYALLKPDPRVSGNEPLPFEKERRFLATLHARLPDMDMHEKDGLFNEMAT